MEGPLEETPETSDTEAAFTGSLSTLCAGSVAAALAITVGRGTVGGGERSRREEETGGHERLCVHEPEMPVLPVGCKN